ncbi:nucleoside-diphosphate kinase [Candidatus Micrarchaeota archaeon]|nr:nucleoside-diphosphate kinase [Candidatus Micrarchaeota archaeon]MBU1930932.1 nucleoside-diphosphate kinase [Candidatus Micrarchaeota archaeon]
MIQRTLVLLKPDAIQRSLIGRILQRFEDAGLKVVGMKMNWIDKEFAKKHYTEDITKRRGEQVRKALIEYIVTGPVLAICLEGIDAIEFVRKMVGTTEPKTAQPGTIRGDFTHQSYGYADAKKIAIKNLVHASGSEQEAKEEIALWFSKEELHSYKTVHEAHTL